MGGGVETGFSKSSLLMQVAAKHSIAITVLLGFASAMENAQFHLHGAGGSGPYEVVKDWIAAFEAKFPEADLSISSVGSGAAQGALWGDVDCENKPVHSLCAGGLEVGEETLWGIGGASLDQSDVDNHAAKDLQQLPALGGPIILAYSKDVTGNLGSKTDVQLNMTFEVIADIFSGKIGRWDHSAIRAINPNLVLPSEKITVVVREDKSGMSETFTEAIKHNVPNSWPDDAVGKLPNWPLSDIAVSSTSGNAFEDSMTSKNFKADGQTGIGLALLRRPYSIGYLEMGYYGELTQFVSQVHVSSISHPNEFVKADASTIRTTMDGLVNELEPDTLDLVLADKDAPKGGYPISRYVHWYIKKSHEEYDNCYQSWLMYKFVEWSFTDPLAEEIALGHGWVVPPPSVLVKALSKLNEMQCVDNNSPEASVVHVAAYTPPPYQEQPPPGLGVKVALSVVGSILGIILLSALIIAIVRKVRAIRKLRQEHERKMESILDQAQTARQDIKYPFTLLRAMDFLQGGELVRHEDLRNAGKLVMYDTLDEVEEAAATYPIVFFSHQWVGFSEPDPEREQYFTMVSALTSVVIEMGWRMADVRVWVDYSCIPQRMRDLQTLAVQSLATYASTAHAFIIAAPECTHEDLGIICDKQTYQRRAWCRAEQVCHTLVNGPLATYVATEHGIAKVKDNWMQEALHIFNGDLSCCQRKHKGGEPCDRERLVVPLLGLFGELYKSSIQFKNGKLRRRSSLFANGGNDEVEAFLKEIEDNRDEMFPQQFRKITTKVKGKGEERTEEDSVEVVTLFGDLVDRMKVRIEREAQESQIMDVLMTADEENNPSDTKASKCDPSETTSVSTYAGANGGAATVVRIA